MAGNKDQASYTGDFLSGYTSSFDYLNGGGRSSRPEFSEGFRSEAEIVQAAWEGVGRSIRDAMESHAGAHR